MTDVRKLSGTLFQGWKLGKELGSGADGIVYIGEKANREAAVKIFFPEALAKNGGLESAKERLDLQLGLIGAKHHSNLVEVFEGGECEGSLYLVMELVPGKSLDKIIDVLPRQAIPHLLRQLASAAEFLENKKLVHRDIKPANIVVSDDFSLLTLLDLGIVFDATLDDDNRLSGKEFVATLRYSPWEFVWRQEEGSDDAWRAITFYQIGATLHDMVMRKPLFDGHDKPRATLYESVKVRTPTIEADDCEPWLIDLAKCCLLKNWRERARLVSWQSFKDPPSDENEIEYHQKLIRVMQLRKDEKRTAEKLEKPGAAQNIRVAELWDLQDKVFMETRQFLMGSPIFPKFDGTHHRIDERHYVLEYAFEANSELSFDSKLMFKVLLSIDEDFEPATELRIEAACPPGHVVFDGKWREMLRVESAALIIRKAFLQVASSVVEVA